MTEARDDLLTVKEYADRFGIHPQTVYTAIRLRRLPYDVIRPAGGEAIRIAVPRDNIQTLKSA